MNDEKINQIMTRLEKQEKMLSVMISKLNLLTDRVNSLEGKKANEEFLPGSKTLPEKDSEENKKKIRDCFAEVIIAIIGDKILANALQEFWVFLNELLNNEIMYSSIATKKKMYKFMEAEQLKHLKGHCDIVNCKLALSIAIFIADQSNVLFKDCNNFTAKSMLDKINNGKSTHSTNDSLRMRFPAFSNTINDIYMSTTESIPKKR